MSIIKTITGLMLVAAVAACGGGGGSASGTSSASTGTSSTTTPAASSTVANILVSAPSPVTLDAAGTRSLTLTIRALDAASGLVKGAVLNLSVDGNTILSTSTVTTDPTTGIATATLTANSSDQVSRLATVSVKCNACSASPGTLVVQVTGATLTVTTSGGTALSAGGNPITLSATVKDSSGNPLQGKTVTFSSTDGSILSLGSTSAVTAASGVATTVVSGLVAGSASVNTSVLGNATSTDFTVSSATGSLTITSPGTGAAMVTNVPQTITVSAPGATRINFTSTLGTFSSAFVNGNAGSSVLTAGQAGSATVTVFDDVGRTASLVLKVSPPASSANKIILSASQTTVGLATATATPTLRLTARALYSVGASDQGVANVPILFSMTGGPGSGEYLTPAYQLTDSSGYAYADFYGGSSASIPNGISVGAQIQNTSVQTGTAPSSNRVQLTVGGQALSVAFGRASVIRESTDKTLYIQDYSVQVTDANNNPVQNSVVTLRLRPVAFSTGNACVPTATYCSEDANANGSLDAGEDGVRYPITETTTSQCPNINALPVPVAAKIDGLLTPVNSVGGAVPATVTTDGTGTAAFSLTYLKASSLWIVDKMSATVLVNGTESGSSTVFRLPASTADVVIDSSTGAATTCLIPPSPY